MSARRHARAGMALTGGTFASAVCSFARNVLIARMLTVEDFGIAAIFVLAVSLVERLSDIGLDRFLIQTLDGDDPRLQAVAQAFQALRGVIGALCLLLLAAPIASLFGVPEIASAFRWFALYPLLRGFIHLDLARMQREMRFKAMILTDLAPQILTLALAAPLILWIGDYQAVLILFIVQAAGYVAASHALAESSYRLAWNGDVIRRMLRFGWPLIINGLLIFGILQGDRAIVGTFFTMEELGWYSAAFTLTLAPAVLISRVLRSFLFPLLSQVQTDPARLYERYRVASGLALSASLLLGVGFYVGGPAFITLIFGEKYAPSASVMGVFAILQMIRVARESQSLAAVALGETKNPMVANIARSLSLVAGIFVAARGMGVEAVAWCAAAGEALAMLVAIVMLKRTCGVGIPYRWPSVVCVVVVGTIAVSLAPVVQSSMMPIVQIGVAGALAAFGAGCIVLTDSNMTRHLRAILKLRPSLTTAPAPCGVEI